MKKRFLVFLLILNTISFFGQQGNYRFNNFGNRSVLLTGNVTGSVTDIGLTYYNPARLTHIEKNGFAFNARAYQLNALAADPLVPGEEDITQVNFTGFPSVLGGTFTMFGQRFAYVALNKFRSDTDVSTSFNESDSGNNANPFSYSTTFNGEVRDNWYGLSWAKEFKNGIGIGASLFGAYYKYKGRRSFNTVLESDDRVVSDLVEYNFDQSSYGLWFKVGAEYTVNNVDLGLNINLPYLEVINQGSYGLKQIRAGSADNTDRNYLYNFQDLDTQRKYPWGVSVGAGIKLDKTTLHLNIDYMSNLNEYERFDLPTVALGQGEATDIKFNEKRNAVINFGIGGEVYLKENVQGFFGFSTDFNAFESETNFFDFQTANADEFNAGTNYYHISGGVDMNFKWGSVILGLTFTQGRNTINIISSEFLENLPVDINSSVDVTNSKLQLVLGFEIPFIDKTTQDIQNQLIKNNN